MLAQTLLMPCMQTPLMVEPSCWPPVLFYKMSFSALNSVLHACKASTLVAEPSPQPFMIDPPREMENENGEEGTSQCEEFLGQGPCAVSDSEVL